MFAIFIFVKIVNSARSKAPVTTRACPYCQQSISKLATKCPYCCSSVKPEAIDAVGETDLAKGIKSLTSKGADISATNSNGETCLFSAARTNNPAVVQVVVDCGADIYDRDNLGSTPVHVAVRWDAPDSIDKLVLLGANVNAQNSSGKTPLAEAVVAG